MVKASIGLRISFMRVDPKYMAIFTLFLCKYKEGTRPCGFGGGEGSGHAIAVFSMGNLASHIRRPIQQYNI